MWTGRCFVCFPVALVWRFSLTSRLPSLSCKNAKKNNEYSNHGVRRRRRATAPRLEPPVQVHHPHHKAVDVAVAAAERVNGLEEGYKGKRAPSLCYSEKNSMNRGKRRQQRGSILPVFLIPAAIASGAVGYPLKQPRCRKRVGKIIAAQWAANKRQVQQMLRRWGLSPLASLRMLK